MKTIFNFAGFDFITDDSQEIDPQTIFLITEHNKKYYQPEKIKNSIVVEELKKV